MREPADDLARRRAGAGRMGGDEAAAREHAAGKLTVRGRIERLFDKDSLIDDVIDARDTRPTLIPALGMVKTKRVERPWRKHGVGPV